MQIQNTSATTSPVTTSGASQSTSPSGGLSNLADESTFLQLLVSQIKNQDPLNPTDSVQFLGQLTQLSQLEQLVGLRQDLKTGTQSSAAPGSLPTNNSNTNQA